MSSLKSCEAYQYLHSKSRSGVIERCWRDDLVYLKTDTEPSQSLHSSHHKAWVLALVTGVMETAGCSCIAGPGRPCSHAAAILWKVSKVPTKNDMKNAGEQGTPIWKGGFWMKHLYSCWWRVQSGTVRQGGHALRCKGSGTQVWGRMGNRAGEGAPTPKLHKGWWDSNTPTQIAKGPWTTGNPLGAELAIRWPFARRFSGSPLVSYAHRFAPYFKNIYFY